MSPDCNGAIAAVVRNLDNSVEVEAQLERAGAARARHADWELALARAAAFAGILNRAGYTGRIVARATTATGRDSGPNAGPARSQGARLDIVIHETEQEPR